ncbi:MAG: DNA mismatch repair endonuclease MutL [Pseudomonadota bacterium]
MKRIHKMDNLLSNQIAAGEVVDRPASVVKELVENSLDAGSTRILIEIEGAGSQLIRITDNGYGIHPQDLLLAVSTHATSKITTIEDLETLDSMGFRGEALASIASVSRFLLTSKRQGEKQAWQVRVQGRDIEKNVLPAAGAEGTQIEVRDLFFNTPARRRFLKSEKTELNHIEETVKRFALSNPSLQIQLKNYNKVIKQFRVPHVQPKTHRIKEVLGKKFLEHSIEFEARSENRSLTGWLGVPDLHRSNNESQHFFINGRVIRDKLLTHAVKVAYSQYLPEGRLPCYALFLQIPSQDVDVNVHPTKHEVRFKQAKQVHDFIAFAVEQNLAKAPVKQQNSASHAVNALKKDVLKEPPVQYRVSRSLAQSTPSRPIATSQVLREKTAFERALLTLPSEPVKNSNKKNSYDLIPLFDDWVLLRCTAKPYLGVISLHNALKQLILMQWDQELENDKNNIDVKNICPLLFPERVYIASELAEKVAQIRAQLKTQGLGYHVLGAHHGKAELVLWGIPLCLSSFPITIFEMSKCFAKAQALTQWEDSSDKMTNRLKSEWIDQMLGTMKSDTISLVAFLESTLTTSAAIDELVQNPESFKPLDREAVRYWMGIK